MSVNDEDCCHGYRVAAAAVLDGGYLCQTTDATAVPHHLHTATGKGKGTYT